MSTPPDQLPESDKASSTQDRRQNINLRNLFLDPNNYRFIDSEGFQKVVTEPEYTREDVQRRTMNLVLGKGGENVKDLIDSFRKSGFLPVDQIQVRQLGGGKYLVVEGNRRVACLKYLQSKYDSEGFELGNLDPQIFQKVPVVYYQDANEAHHLILMGLKHISGNKKWPAINQAELVRDLHVIHELSPEDICHSISISRREFNTTLSTLKLIDSYKESDYGDQFKSEMYSIFREITRNAAIRDWLSWDEKIGVAHKKINLERLFSWISEDEIDEDDSNEEESYLGSNHKLEPVLTKATHIREFALLVNDENALANLNSTRSLMKASLSSEVLSKDKVKNSISLISQEITSVFSMMRHLGDIERLDLSEAANKLKLMLEAGGNVSAAESARSYLQNELPTHFKNINIKKYKRFSDCQLDNLRRINIFAGLNNCGKTSVLEAIELLAALGTFKTILDISARRAKCQTSELSSDWVYRQFADFALDATVDTEKLNVSAIKVEDETQDQAFYIGSIEASSSLGTQELSSTTHLFEKYPYQSAGNIRSLIRCQASSPYATRQQEAFVAAYATAVETGLKSDLVDFIRTHVDSKFESIELIRERFIVTRSVDGESVRSDLSSFGDGLQRIFNVCVLFASAQNGVIVIDEAESGIHKSLLDEFANFIYALAKRFEVQVFLTTHSKECIDSFITSKSIPLNEMCGFALLVEHSKTISVRVDGEQLRGLITSIDFDLRGNDE